MLRPTLENYFLKYWEKTFQKLILCQKYSIKISYNCSRSVKSIISGHNKQILHPKPQQYFCNGRDKNNCPLDNKCLTQQIIYQADVTSDTDNTYNYSVGLAETSFKDRYRNHILSFNNEQHKNKTELSKYFWYR